MPGAGDHQSALVSHVCSILAPDRELAADQSLTRDELGDYIALRAPQLDSVIHAVVRDWPKRETDQIENGEPVVILAANGSGVVVPAPADGVLKKIVVHQG
jgi:hypothetical protein